MCGCGSTVPTASVQVDMQSVNPVNAQPNAQNQILSMGNVNVVPAQTKWVSGNKEYTKTPNGLRIQIRG